MSLSLPFGFRPDIFVSLRRLSIRGEAQGADWDEAGTAKQTLTGVSHQGSPLVSACVWRLGSLCREDKGEAGRGWVSVLGNSKGTQSRLFWCQKSFWETSGSLGGGYVIMQTNALLSHWEFKTHGNTLNAAAHCFSSVHRFSVTTNPTSWVGLRVCC